MSPSPATNSSSNKISRLGAIRLPETECDCAFPRCATRFHRFQRLTRRLGHLHATSAQHEGSFRHALKYAEKQYAESSLSSHALRDRPAVHLENPLRLWAICATDPGVILLRDVDAAAPWEEELAIDPARIERDFRDALRDWDIRLACCRFRRHRD